MKEQRTTEWIEGANRSYHERQFAEPYRSTVQFCDWLEEQGCIDALAEARILDIGSGMGSNVFYMGGRYRNSRFDGIDINPQMIESGNSILRRNERVNCELMEADLYDLPERFVGRYDGVVSFQTLSWLPDYEAPLEKLAELGAGWIGFTSLFCEADIGFSTLVKDYTRPSGGNEYSEYYYNVYSLQRVQNVLRRSGYSDFRHARFEIDIDLPKSDQEAMRTYTEKLEDGRRLQISGCVLMPWYFVLARRLDDTR